jgi:hypothetical protein
LRVLVGGGVEVVCAGGGLVVVGAHVVFRSVDGGSG